MLASLASVSISVTNVLAVEASERMVHRRCHRALMARMPEALAATLHPEHKLPPPGAKTGPSSTAKTQLADGGGRGRGITGASSCAGDRAQRSLRRACSSRLALWRPRSALRGCHQAKRWGASRSLGVVSSAAEPTTAVAVIVAFLFLDSPVTQAFFLFARVVRRSRALRLSLA